MRNLFPLEFSRFIYFNQQKLHILFEESVTLNLVTSFVLFGNIQFSPRKFNKVIMAKYANP